MTKDIYDQWSFRYIEFWHHISDRHHDLFDICIFDLFHKCNVVCSFFLLVWKCVCDLGGNYDNIICKINKDMTEIPYLSHFFDSRSLFWRQFLHIYLVKKKRPIFVDPLF